MPTTAIQCKCGKCSRIFDAPLDLPMGVDAFCNWCALLRCPGCRADSGRIFMGAGGTDVVVAGGVVSGHDHPTAPAPRSQAAQGRPRPLPVDGPPDAPEARPIKPKAARARPLSEAAITKGIVRLLSRVRGAFVLKTHGGPMQRAGLPDLLVWIPRPLPQLCIAGAFEVKVPGNNPTPLQDHTIKKMQAAGVLVCVVTSADDVKRWLSWNGIEIEP